MFGCLERLIIKYMYLILVSREFVFNKYISLVHNNEDVNEINHMTSGLQVKVIMYYQEGQLDPKFAHRRL